MGEFAMPALGADMDEGKLIEWLVRPGDTVHRGDLMAVVETAKSAIEVETFVDGVVEQLLVEPGVTVPVGTVMATITEPVAAPSGARPQPRVTPLARKLATHEGVDLSGVSGTGRGGTITRPDVERAATHHPAAVAASVSAPRPSPAPPVETGVPPRPAAVASPYARRLAAELGVDLHSVRPAQGGAVRAADVRAAATAAPPPVEPTPTVEAAHDELSARRLAIATLMSRAKREIPHYYVATTVDLHATYDWLRERNLARPVSKRLVPAAVVLKATATAARRHPEVNGFWTDGRLQQAEHVHLGVAVSLRGGGLVAPALHDADLLTVDELMSALRDLVARARAGRLRRAEMADPTLTVTNLGDQGVEEVLGVIYPPQVALLGVGKVVERPWAVDGLLGVRPLVRLTLSADHRATDGYVGARFLADIDQLLQTPEGL